MKNPHSRTELSLLAAACLAFVTLSPTARAVDPPPDGGYPNGNTAEGEDSLFSLTDGIDNTAVGFQSLFSNNGSENTATGFQSLAFNTTGANNTAAGFEALGSNTSGASNTATGSFSLFGNTTGFSNTASGSFALNSNKTGGFNTANGFGALSHNFTGNTNTADGFQALFCNTTGSNNIALGGQAGIALTTGDNNIDIGNAGVADETGIIRIGTAGTQTATFIAGIREAPLVHGVAVGVGITADGQLGVRASSARFKEAIRPMDKASEAIFSLQPVTFRYKKALDPSALPQFGLVAEQVAKVDPDLVVSDEKGKPFSVRYEEVNAMLLNEFLKEHHKVEALEATVTAQQKGFESQIAALTAALKAQAAQIQKVSDRLRAQAVAPRVVANN